MAEMICCDQLLCFSVEINYRDYLLRSAVEVINCVKLLKFSVEISWCDLKVINALKT